MIRKVELVGGPADGKRISIPLEDRAVRIPIRAGRHWKPSIYAERGGQPAKFDYRPTDL